MNDNRSTEARLECLFVPRVLLLIILVWREGLTGKLRLLSRIILLLLAIGFLLLSGSLRLVLQVEADGLLEVTLDRTALMSLLERAQHLNVNLGAVEGTITMVVGPWLAEVVKSSLKCQFGLVPLLLSSETVLRAR